MLAACGDKGCSRDKLVGLVWPEREEENAKHLLATAVYVLRSTLGEEAVLTTGEYLRLNPDIVRSDVQMFAEALEGVRLDEAVGTYGGPFLEGFYLKEAPEFERWVESERQRLADAHADALERLADRAEAAGDFRRAVDWWRRLIACDPYNTRVALRLLQAMAESGDRANALRYAQEHERLLRDELGMEPDPQLVALAERLRVEPARVSEGVKATTADPALITVDEAGSEAAPRRRLLSWRNAGLSFVAALAMWGVVATGRMMFGERGAASEAERQSIAVLPFVNLSREEATEPFTDGIHDDILIHLYKIADLKVISRTSVMEYRDTRKNLRQIADELGVATILEGGVQRTGDRVRINVELIDAETDEHLWAETYEEDLTADNVFTIQTDIAQRIASALKAQLSPEESERIAARPTENLEAYDAYLTAQYYRRRARASRDDRRFAIQSYERAIALDPQFAQAYAELSALQSFVYRVYYVSDHDPLRLARARALADTALSIDPDLAAVHIALGNLHYFGEPRDYERALQEYAIAATLEPNNSEVYGMMAVAQRRAGCWEEALASAKKAVELGPREVNRLVALGTTYSSLRDYPAAIRTFDRAIALAPDNRSGYVWKALALLLQGGDRQKIYEAHQQAWPNRWFALGARSDYRSSLRLLYEYVPDTVWADQRLTSHLRTVNYFLAKATFYSAAGEAPLATANYDSARVHLVDPGGGLLPHVRELWGPYTSGGNAALGVIYAGLGLKDEAIREARLAVELVPVSDDATDGPWNVINLAEVYVMVGEHDAAIDQLEYLLSIPAHISVALLRIDPLWDPLRDHPRFQALLEEYE